MERVRCVNFTVYDVDFSNINSVVYVSYNNSYFMPSNADLNPLLAELRRLVSSHTVSPVKCVVIHFSVLLISAIVIVRLMFLHLYEITWTIDDIRYARISFYFNRSTWSEGDADDVAHFHLHRDYSAVVNSTH